MESLLSNIAHKIHDNVEEWKDSPTKSKKILPMVQKYYPKRFDSLTLDQFIKEHESKKLEDVYYFNVGSYSTKFTPSLLEEWASELGVSSQSQILMPANTIADLNELKSELEPEEYDEVVKGMEGKYVPVDKPLSVGWMSMMELYHIPVYSNKVTSSMFGVDINEWKDEPIMGGARYRTTGQKI